MRTVLLDLGPLAHLAGVGALVGTSMSDSDSLVSSAGKGIVVVNGVIESIQESFALEEEYGAAGIHSHGVHLNGSPPPHILLRVRMILE